MITSDREYRAVKEELQKFEMALEHAQNPSAEDDPIAYQVVMEGLQSETETLRTQLSAYEAVKAGRLADLDIGFDELGAALMLARTLAGLTQQELAERVGIQQQQVHR